MFSTLRGRRAAREGVLQTETDVSEIDPPSSLSDLQMSRPALVEVVVVAVVVVVVVQVRLVVGSVMVVLVLVVAVLVEG